MIPPAMDAMRQRATDPLPMPAGEWPSTVVRRTLALALAALIASAGIGSTARAQDATAAEWQARPSRAGAADLDTLLMREHTRVLADDRLRGRDTGSAGERMAADYIIGELERLGLRGAGADGAFRQPLPLLEVRLDSAGSELIVGGDADRERFRAETDFVLDLVGRAGLRDFSGSAILAGTAATAEQALAGYERLDGHIVVVIGLLGREALALLPDWTARGAEGIVLLEPEPFRFQQIRRARGGTRLVVDADVDNPLWQPTLPVLVGGPTTARALLAGAEIDGDALAGDAPFEAVPLERRIEARLDVRASELPAANIAAVLPGSDPELRDEFVAYSAHYDHLGIGAPDERGDSIYNGFSDNAAGVAMLLGIAEALRDSPPARSLLFLFFTGEERGLLGSAYYASSPVVPLDRTVAVINLDAGAPPAPPRDWRIAGGQESTLGRISSRVADAHGWIAAPAAASPNSDYWPFLRAGVPAIFPIPGQDWEGVSDDEKNELHERWDHYHQPADEWHPDYPFVGLMRYARLALAIGREVADSPARPRMLTPEAPPAPR